MKFWEDEEFKSFWEWLEEAVAEADAGWMVRDILDIAIENWQKLPDCPECGKKLVCETIEVWSKTGNHRLSIKYSCKKCKHVTSEIDFKPKLIEKVKTGQVLVKDVTILKEELGID